MIQLQQAQQTQNSQAGGIQIVQQIVTPSGEIQQIPVSIILSINILQIQFSDFSLISFFHIPQNRFN